LPQLTLQLIIKYVKYYNLKEGKAMFCVNCGNKIDDGEHICKGCGKLSASIREELLAMSEKTADFKCEKCGGAIKAGHHFCATCGAATGK
jgi:predicted amidophosphoribosyltransferase